MKITKGRRAYLVMSERDKCRAWGCIGCGACVPGGYIP